MQDNERRDEFRRFREVYNSPPEPPRDEMWEAIQARLEDSEPGTSDVADLEEARQRRQMRFPMPMRWASGAAAILVLGIGIGRMTSPTSAPVADPGATLAPRPTILHAAAVDHLSRTESLLTLVRADARAGRLEPQLAAWSRTLLTQTRLLMYAQAMEDPVMVELLKDLELVLVQILAVANAPETDPERVRSELTLALHGLDERDVLPRIQAVVPAGPGYRGT